MKKSTLILLISTAIFFTSTLYLLFLNFQKPNKPIVETQLPTLVPTKAINTVDWKTYTDKNWDYSVKYPADWKVVSFEKPIIDIMPATSDDRNLGSINLSLTMNQETPDIPPSFTDFSSVDPSTCGNSTWAVKNNQNDSFACWKYNRDVWFIPTYSSVVTKDIYSQIMSSFKFISSSPTPTKTVTLTKIKILDSSTWVEHSCGSISYKIPAEGYDVKCLQDNATSFNVSISNKGGYGNVASINIRQYDGGSRRQYWIKTIDASDSDISKYLRFQESLFGSVTGLDVFASGGWWQGGYASPILIANGKTIIAVHGGRNFNDETGKILRWDFTDTIASTIKFL